MTVHEASLALTSFMTGVALTHSAWSGDWSWFLCALAGICGGVGFGLRASVRDRGRGRG